MWIGSRLNPLCTPANEEQSDTFADTAPLTGYEPNELDNFHVSETTEFFIQSPPATAGP